MEHDQGKLTINQINQEMANLNIQIDLTKIPGAREMDVTRGDVTRKCVVIPIDNAVGTVCDGYRAQGPDGLPVKRFFNEVKLNLVGIEYRQKRHGISHGLKPAFSKETTERMTEEEMYNTPWCGTVKPWGGTGDEGRDDVGDLPADDAKRGW